MPEIKSEVKIMVYNMKCDKCGGLMQYTGHDVVCISNFGKERNTKFYHKCNICGYEEKYDIRYPYQKFEPIEDTI